MKIKTLRTLIPVLILFLAWIGFILHTGFGNISAIGWSSISLLCPLGALGTMLASKTIVPHVLVSLGIMLVAIVLVGRAFCAWGCPVPLVEKLRGAFSKKVENEDEVADKLAHKSHDELTAEEKELLRSSCKSHCAACMPGDEASRSRYLVLGAALLSALVFGYPVFCLICPIGLTFAFIFVIIMLFGHAELTISVILIPAILLIEVVFFRKWCNHLCPLSALLGLVSKLNRTLRPQVDGGKCIDCGRCAMSCEVGIDPHKPELGVGLEECTKCHLCAEVCPTKAITFPLLPASKKRRPELISETPLQDDEMKP